MDSELTTLDQMHRHPVLSAEQEADLVRRMLAGKQAAQQEEHSTDTQQRVALQEQIVAGDAARAELIRCNIRLVGSIARRFGGSSTIPYDDLVAFGIRGLITAIDRFDPAKTGRLSTFATHWIRQAIGRGIADEGRIIRLPVHVGEFQQRLNRAVSSLSATLNRRPTLAELATALEVSPQKLSRHLLAWQETDSLNRQIDPYTDGGKELGAYIPAATDRGMSVVVEQRELRDALMHAIQHTLTERERTYLCLYVGFPDGERMTYEAIGNQVGLTRERVRQVINDGLRKLRDRPELRAFVPPGNEEGATE